MSSSKITHVSGHPIVLQGDDVDTDRIIPARFLKAISFAGLEAHAFEDERKAAAAAGHTHPFDDPRFAGARVLIVNNNFGCGSSREHAPQALYRWGIRAIVGESFAEIFAGNSLMIGLPCLTAPKADIARLQADALAHPTSTVEIDLHTCHITLGATSVAAKMPPATQQAFVTGDWDATGLLLAHYEDVQATSARLPYVSGF